MTQKEYLQKALGAEPGFEMLIEDVYPKMEVRAFLKEGIQEFREGGTDGKRRARTRLKLIYAAWKFDKENDVKIRDSLSAHESESICRPCEPVFFLRDGPWNCMTCWLETAGWMRKCGKRFGNWQ